MGNVGQDLVESIFSFGYYKPISVTQLTQASINEYLHLTKKELLTLAGEGGKVIFRLRPLRAALLTKRWIRK